MQKIAENILAWVDGVELEHTAREQLLATSQLPIIFKHLAVMPDCHYGIGATVGSVVPTIRAVIPAAVGVDIGCGMVAHKLFLKAADLPDNLQPLRLAIEEAVPVGRAEYTGAYPGVHHWATLMGGYRRVLDKEPKLLKGNELAQLGTLGGGNHFIEICIDEQDFVWVMLHSGSRGVGNRIGTHYIEQARKECDRLGIGLPDRNLAYLEEGQAQFDNYMEAVYWAQNYARWNREVMMTRVYEVLERAIPKPLIPDMEMAVNCHHNYVQQETHFGEKIFVTRKGAVQANQGQLGIIPGSMGAKSYIVRGKGNPLSFNSCSHGAGRRMSRGEAKRKFTVEDHEAATFGVECRKDVGVLDETPGYYKDIDAVMAAQKDLVDIVHTLRQVLCVKG